MGRTLPSVTQVFLHEQESFGRFRRALRRSDQHALDDLFAAAHQHLAAAAYAANALPFEIFLLAMLLEEHKQVLRLQTRLEHLYRASGLGEQWDEFILARGEPAPFSALPPPAGLACAEMEAGDPAAAVLPEGEAGIAPTAAAPPVESG